MKSIAGVARMLCFVTHGCLSKMSPPSSHGCTWFNLTFPLGQSLCLHVKQTQNKNLITSKACEAEFQVLILFAALGAFTLDFHFDLVLFTWEYLLPCSFLLAKSPLSFSWMSFPQTSLLGSCFISRFLQPDVSSDTFLLLCGSPSVASNFTLSPCWFAAPAFCFCSPPHTSCTLYLHHMQPVLFPYSSLIYIPPSPFSFPSSLPPLCCLRCLGHSELLKKAFPCTGLRGIIYLVHYSSCKQLNKQRYLFIGAVILLQSKSDEFWRIWSDEQVMLAAPRAWLAPVLAEKLGSIKADTTELPEQIIIIKKWKCNSFSFSTGIFNVIVLCLRSRNEQSCQIGCNPCMFCLTPVFIFVEARWARGYAGVLQLFRQWKKSGSCWTLTPCLLLSKRCYTISKSVI